MGTERSSWWSLTINNPDDTSFLSLSESPPAWVRELWYQQEVGAQGTLHIQGAVNTTQQRFGTLKTWLPTAHIESARNPTALKRYCQKSDTAVPGTFVHWKRPANEIVEEDGESAFSAYTLNEILLMLVAQGDHDDDDWVMNNTIRTSYEEAVEKIARIAPQLVERVTRQNVWNAYRFTVTAFTEHYLKLSQGECNEPAEQMDDEEYPEYLIEDICDGCDKDECVDCAPFNIA